VGLSHNHSSGFSRSVRVHTARITPPPSGVVVQVTGQP
jgi:hypothetical protein